MKDLLILEIFALNSTVYAASFQAQGLKKLPLRIRVYSEMEGERERERKRAGGVQ